MLSNCFHNYIEKCQKAYEIGLFLIAVLLLFVNNIFLCFRWYFSEKMKKIKLKPP